MLEINILTCYLKATIQIFLTIKELSTSDMFEYKN